jgi:hypothetical protein
LLGSAIDLALSLDNRDCIRLFMRHLYRNRVRIPTALVNVSSELLGNANGLV